MINQIKSHSRYLWRQQIQLRTTPPTLIMVYSIRESLSRFHPGLATNQYAIEKLILLLLGLNLRKGQGGSNLDFQYSSNLLRKGIEIVRGIFGDEEGSAAAIHLKNMYNITAPGFFKNLVFKGGPNITAGVISIKDKLNPRHRDR